MNFDPKQYWEERLKKHCDLEGVGCIGRSATLNQFLYRAKTRAMNRALSRLPLALASSNLRMLDIGAGTGFWIDYFLTKGVNSITGIDIAPSAVSSLKAKYSKLTDKTLEFRCTDIASSDLSLKPDIDLVTAIDVLYHIIADEKFYRAIKNVAQVLKPGGYLFLTDILSSQRDDISPQQHVHWRDLDQYKQELERNGLDVVYLAPIYTLLQSPVDAKGIFGRLLNLFYYQISFRLTSKAASTPMVIEKAYLNILYNLDSLTTLFPRFGVSTKLLVARRT